MPLMARVHTHYDNLKVARNAPPEVIRAAYKTLSQKYHPDRNGNSEKAIRIIQIINSAYEVLSDPVRRQEHDAWIARAEADFPPEQPKVTTGSYGQHRHGATKSRQRTSFHIYRAPRRSAWTMAKTIQRMRMVFDQFSRKLFRRL
jgi:curved DNA-binding protein CbpA